MKAQPNIALSTRLSPEVAEMLDQYCRETGQTKAATVEAALKEYIKKGGK